MAKYGRGCGSMKGSKKAILQSPPRPPTHTGSHGHCNHGRDIRFFGGMTRSRRDQSVASWTRVTHTFQLWQPRQGIDLRATVPRTTAARFRPCHIAHDDWAQNSQQGKCIRICPLSAFLKPLHTLGNQAHFEVIVIGFFPCVRRKSF